MSNERPGMVRSPLAWHVSGTVSAQPPPPPDAIYNFMSANHKNVIRTKRETVEIKLPVIQILLVPKSMLDSFAIWAVEAFFSIV